MYTFRKGTLIDRSKKIKIIKIYKNIKTSLPIECNKSDDIRDWVENLLIETIVNVPEILNVVDDEGKGIIDLVIENKLWGALFEIGKRKEFLDIINEKLLIAQKTPEKDLNC